MIYVIIKGNIPTGGKKRTWCLPSWKLIVVEEISEKQKKK